MTRKIIQDIIVVKKKAPFIKREDMRPIPEEKKPEFESSDKRDSFKKLFPENLDKKKKFEELYEQKAKVSKNSHIFLWILSIVAIATVLFFVSGMFATATVTITPKEELINLNDTYTANTDTTIPGLHYTVLTLTEDLSQGLTTSGDQDVQRKATGKAIIYNDYSSATQRLITNTRLETTDGLVYRIIQSVNVPGIKTVNGVKTPGSVEVTIVADQPGAQYNMKVTDLKGDFTIPGFQGTPQYSTFYARLSGDAIGGYIGDAKTVSADVLSVGRTQLKNNLQTQLIKDMYATTTASSTIFKNDYFIQYTDLPDTSDDKSYTINEEATVYAIVFNTNELSTFIAKNKLADYDGTEVDALWNDNVSVTVVGKTVSLWTENSLKVTFTGDLNMVWSYDAGAILNEIKGQDKSVLSDVLEKDKDSITQIEAHISPAWETTFPKNTQKIKIIDSIRDSQ